MYYFTLVIRYFLIDVFPPPGRSHLSCYRYLVYQPKISFDHLNRVVNIYKKKGTENDFVVVTNQSKVAENVLKGDIGQQ